MNIYKKFKNWFINKSSRLKKEKKIEQDKKVEFYVESDSEIESEGLKGNNYNYVRVKNKEEPNLKKTTERFNKNLCFDNIAYEKDFDSGKYNDLIGEGKVTSD